MVNKESTIYIADSIYESGAGGNVPPGAVDIGGKLYSTVEINGVTWLGENLDFRYPGLIINDAVKDDYIAKACYYNKNEQVNGKYGLLYNYQAVYDLQNNKDTLIPGWHIPTQEEWENLINFLGSMEQANIALKSSTDWNGSNAVGFNALPGGYQWDSNYFLGIGEEIEFATRSFVSGNKYKVILLVNNNSNPLQYENISYGRGTYIRLVKDP